MRFEHALEVLALEGIENTLSRRQDRPMGFAYIKDFMRNAGHVPRAV
jgi:hypothetical protein